MSALFELCFLPENKTQELCESCGNYYRLPGSQILAMITQPIWCEQCSAVTHGEVIQSDAELEKSIRDLERLIIAESGLELDLLGLGRIKPDDSEERRRVADMKLRREWRALRKSPPRCIYCGSTRITRLEAGKALEIPNGTVTLNVVGFCDTYNGWFYTLEGERLC